MSEKNNGRQTKVPQDNSEEEKFKLMPKSKIFYVDNSIAYNYNDKRDLLKSAEPVERPGKIRKLVTSPITNETDETPSITPRHLKMSTAVRQNTFCSTT